MTGLGDWCANKAADAGGLPARAEAAVERFEELLVEMQAMHARGAAVLAQLQMHEAIMRNLIAALDEASGEPEPPASGDD